MMETGTEILNCAKLITSGKASASSMRNFWKEAAEAGLVTGQYDRHTQLTPEQFDWFMLRTQKRGVNGSAKNGLAPVKARRKREAKDPDIGANHGENRPYFVPKNGANIEGILDFAPKTGEQNSQETAGNWIKSRWFLVLSMMVLFTAQAIHTAGFFWHNTPFEGTPFMRLTLALVCAIGLDTIALVMTAHGGGRSYLYIFAMFHFTINALFHTQQYLIQAFENLTFFEFSVKMLGAGVLSSALAYGLFSYTELFTKGFK